MADRENHSDSSSQSGKSYPAGPAAPSTATVKNIAQTLSVTASNNLSSRVFNGHAVQVLADGAVWDTVSNAYLQPGTDFNPGDVQRR
jgi:hypothetical protein